MYSWISSFRASGTPWDVENPDSSCFHNVKLVKQNTTARSEKLPESVLSPSIGMRAWGIPSTSTVRTPNLGSWDTCRRVLIGAPGSTQTSEHCALARAQQCPRPSGRRRASSKETGTWARVEFSGPPAYCGSKVNPMVPYYGSPNSESLYTRYITHIQTTCQIPLKKESAHTRGPQEIPCMCRAQKKYSLRRSRY